MKHTYKSQIAAKCCQCLSVEQKPRGRWRADVTACAKTDCALHVVRPVTIQAKKP